MAESPEEGEFRVTDRRRRGEEAEPPPARQQEEAGPSVASERGQAPSEGAPSAGPSVPGPPGPGADRPSDRAERSLEGLFLMLASSAVVALGQAADPTGQVRDRDPAAAAGAIDLLVLLREKTEGHRTPGEARLLDELIYDLQLRFVAATKPRS